MTRVLVWDVPTRLFHWMLAGSFLAAFGIATLVGDDGALFPVHALLGLVAVFLVAVRLVWGLVGSRWSRFTSFAWNPADLVAYLRNAVTGRHGRSWPGHNPGSTWAAAVMFACILGLGATGVAMSGGSEAAEELHELFAYGMLATVGVHLAGIALHTIRHREPIALAMVDGRKVADGSAAIPSSRPFAGAALLAVTGLWVGALAAGFDSQAGTLTVPVVGATLSLGEGEHGEGGHEEEDDD